MVATAGGVAFALAPLAAVCCLVLWLVSFAAFRYASVSSMLAAVALPRALLRVRGLVADRGVHVGRGARRPRAAPAERPSAARGHRAAVHPRGRALIDTDLGRREDPARRGTSRGRGRSEAVGLRGVVVLVAAGALAAAFAQASYAAPWCGSPSVQDRAPAVAGRTIRVVYVIPSDGADRTARAGAPDQRGRGRDRGLVEDAGRRAGAALRPCRVPLRAAGRHRHAAAHGLRRGRRARQRPVRADRERGPGGDRATRATRSTSSTTTARRTTIAICGQGGGTADGAGIAIVYLAACSGVPTAPSRRTSCSTRSVRLPRAGRRTPVRTRAGTRATATRTSCIRSPTRRRSARSSSTSGGTTTTATPAGGSTSRTRRGCGSSHARCL